MTRMHRLLALPVLALLLVACAGAAAPTPTQNPPPTQSPDPTPASPPVQPTDPAANELDAIIGEWLLEEGTLDGQPIPMVPEAPITLSVNAIRVTGTSACNSYGADWVFTNDGLRLDDITMTLMLCEGHIGASETAYLEALRRTATVELDGERLVFAGEGAELRFVPADD